MDVNTAFCSLMLRSLRASMKRCKTKKPVGGWAIKVGRNHWNTMLVTSIGMGVRTTLWMLDTKASLSGLRKMIQKVGSVLNQRNLAMDENILRKIKKCLALSASSNANEAASALRQAQKLMELHNVNAIDLKRADIEQKDVKSKASVSRAKDWEVALLNTVAKAFGCKLMFLRSHSYAENVFASYTLIGLKDQVWMAHYTAEVLQWKLMRARADFVKSLGDCGRWHKVREADGFCTGWVLAIAKTVQEFAMPPETRKLIEDMVVEQTGGRNTKTQERDRGELGMASGYLAGKNESIHRPLKDKEHLKLLK